MRFDMGAKPLVNHGRFPFQLLLITIFLRLMDLAWVRSSYVPDEYWQSIEVAHKIAFGYGNLTWEWVEGVRSYAYVSIFALAYKVLALFEIDTRGLVVLTPRVMQACISAVGDVYFIRWVADRRNGQYSWAIISWITCTFISYCSTRTLMNTLEMNLSSIALYYYPWTPKTNNVVFITIVAFMFFLRPTSAVIWLPLVVTNIFSNRSSVVYFLKRYLPVGILVGGLMTGFDSYMHGSLVFTPWNFFKFNVLKNISQFYGTHDFAWYIYCGIPVVLGLQTIPFVLGVYKASSKVKDIRYNIDAQMFVTIVWSVSIFSLSPHKEFRFLLPLLPMMVYVSSNVLSRWSMTAKSLYIYAVGTLMISTHMTALIFLGQFHQMGTLETVAKLGALAKNNLKVDILYLAPCHSFPSYSHLHANVSTRHLECKPNLEGLPEYQDEADEFYNNTNSWLKREYHSSARPLPSILVKFNTLNITNFIHFNGYNLTAKIFNSYYYPDRTGREVEVYRRQGVK